jgi:hypothetical protein
MPLSRAELGRDCPTRFGRHVRYDAAEVKRWLDASEGAHESR